MSLWHRYDNDKQRGDIAQAPASTPSGLGNLMTDEGFISAVEISLFTDRRAPEGSALPGNNNDRPGWWGDRFFAGDFADPNFQIGSLIWLLERSKITQQTMGELRDAAEDAVAWMRTFGIMDSARAVVERIDYQTLCFSLEIKRPDDPAPLWVGPWEVTFSGI